MLGCLIFDENICANTQKQQNLLEKTASNTTNTAIGTNAIRAAAENIQQKNVDDAATTAAATTTYPNSQ